MAGKVTGRLAHRMTTIGQPVPELPSANLERSARYYTEKLGFTRQWAFPDIISISRDDVAIFFRKTEERITPQVHWIFSEDVDATHTEMKEAGAAIVEPIENKPWGLRQFTVEDPDGHRFHIHHDYDRAEDRTP